MKQKTSKDKKITIPTKNGIWEWSRKGFGFKKDQKQNDSKKFLLKDSFRNHQRCN